ncbi:hypothetical protein [Kamptonema sp. UHCC 0994]|uniref:hypothetical protein n=1 Tax=Kamptonema sp. UHCC 0994 TaxID=3031329 RepID=UPI0023BAE4A0|nr:hypothetical protein [Kamptonema sp. UHCC 0994]MDF0556060.1 hypothetical protein [Kamptonema sp. UHCC 0994]
MLRKLTIFFMAVSLCLTTIGCGSSNPKPNANQNINNTSAPNINRNANGNSAANRLAQGQYPVQQATYNDADGEYTLMLLNTPQGSASTYRTTDLQMARLTDEEIAGGKKSYLSIEGNQPSLHLTEDFKIEYVHNVTETVSNPQTGQTETVVVRQQSNFWAPFAGALAGQALGSLLFTPRYYVPPVYQPGVIMTGYGGYGNSYREAVQGYQTRYQAPPPAVKNRQTLRTTGGLRSPSVNRPTTRPSSPGNRSTGSGYGGSNLRRSPSSQPSQNNRQPSFGSGGRSRPATPARRGGFGSGRRR